ncbi:MAG: sarcosine oxidase subunit delta [Proteobacteria bacterium]|nr:sarcosine oxidase subunit delta [Pseudomonadota bacterium]
MSFTVTCPICGKRDLYEFRFGGEERGPRPDEAGLTPESWCDWLHLRTNRGGPQLEWWYHHQGCGTWFSIWRDTLTNREVRPLEEES